jgi:hypothetical protein
MMTFRRSCLFVTFAAAAVLGCAESFTAEEESTATITQESIVGTEDWINVTDAFRRGEDAHFRDGMFTLAVAALEL